MNRHSRHSRTGRAGLLTVAALATAFGVTLLQITDVLDTAMQADPTTGRSATVRVLLALAAVVFTAIALYVSGIVTSNTVATIIAGRRRTIALRRLIGTTASTERRALAVEGTGLGAAGAALGTALGTVVSLVITRIGVATGLIGDTRYTYLHVSLALPILAVIAMAWLASWHGSARVLTVRPIEALGNAVDYTYVQARPRRRRNRLAAALVGSGAALLAVSVWLGLLSAFAVLLGVLGGILSATGIVLAADLVVPPVLRAVGLVLGHTPTARLAAANALKRPERSARLALGLLVAVTLITTFIVAMSTYRHVLQLAQHNDPRYYQGTKSMLDASIAVFTALIAFSAVIAAVGLVNNLLMDVHQRTREIGLLRAVGLTRRQLAAVMLAEAALLTTGVTLFGLILGTAYGWCGAQALVGGIHASPGLVWPSVPLSAVAAIAAGAVAITLFATLIPGRAAGRVSPTLALAVD